VPIEYEIDKKLGMSGSDAVKQLGLAKYNEECKAIVMRFASEWRQTIERLGERLMGCRYAFELRSVRSVD
jgi:isoleucyl-tRNA synthetase